VIRLYLLCSLKESMLRQHWNAMQVVVTGRRQLLLLKRRLVILLFVVTFLTTQS